MILYTILTGERNPIVAEYYEKLAIMERWCKDHGITMGHMKFTCPNPHSGEKVYGQRIWGFGIDLGTRVGMHMTIEEYNLMWSTDSGEKAEVDFETLMSRNPFEDFRGAIAAEKFRI